MNLRVISAEGERFQETLRVGCIFCKKADSASPPLSADLMPRRSLAVDSASSSELWQSSFLLSDSSLNLQRDEEPSGEQFEDVEIGRLGCRGYSSGQRRQLFPVSMSPFPSQALPSSTLSPLANRPKKG